MPEMHDVTSAPVVQTSDVKPEESKDVSFEQFKAKVGKIDMAVAKVVSAVKAFFEVLIYGPRRPFVNNVKVLYHRFLNQKLLDLYNAQRKRQGSSLEAPYEVVDADSAEEATPSEEQKPVAPKPIYQQAYERLVGHPLKFVETEQREDFILENGTKVVYADGEDHQISDEEFLIYTAIKDLAENPNVSDLKYYLEEIEYNYPKNYYSVLTALRDMAKELKLPEDIQNFLNQEIKKFDKKEKPVKFEATPVEVTEEKQPSRFWKVMKVVVLALAAFGAGKVIYDGVRAPIGQFNPCLDQYRTGTMTECREGDLSMPPILDSIIYPQPIGPESDIRYSQPIGPHLVPCDSSEIRYSQPIGPESDIRYPQPIGPQEAPVHAHAAQPACPAPAYVAGYISDGRIPQSDLVRYGRQILKDEQAQRRADLLAPLARPITPPARPITPPSTTFAEPGFFGKAYNWAARQTEGEGHLASGEDAGRIIDAVVPPAL